MIPVAEEQTGCVDHKEAVSPSRRWEGEVDEWGEECRERVSDACLFCGRVEGPTARLGVRHH